MRDVLARCRAPTPGPYGSPRTYSSAASSTAAPPSERMQQCSLVNGSAIIGPDRTSSTVIGSRNIASGLRAAFARAWTATDGELLERRAVLVHVAAGGHRVLGDQRVAVRDLELERAAGAEGEVARCGGPP